MSIHVLHPCCFVGYDGDPEDAEPCGEPCIPDEDGGPPYVCGEHSRQFNG